MRIIRKGFKFLLKLFIYKHDYFKVMVTVEKTKLSYNAFDKFMHIGLFTDQTEIGIFKIHHHR